MTQAREPKPVNAKRRALLKNILFAIDVLVGVVAFLGGVAAIAAAPPTIVAEVTLPGFILAWGLLLLLGGLGIAVGRVTGVWILETTGIVSSATGAAIYLAVLFSAVADTPGVLLALALIVLAILAMLRRYVELQLFLSEPGVPGFTARMRAILKTRVPRPFVPDAANS